MKYKLRKLFVSQLCYLFRLLLDESSSSETLLLIMLLPNEYQVVPGFAVGNSTGEAHECLDQHVCFYLLYILSKSNRNRMHTVQNALRVCGNK